MHLLLLNQPYISGRNQTWNFKNCSVWNDCIYMYDQEGIVFLFLIPSLMVFSISVFRHLCIYFWPHWVFAAARGGFSRSDEQGLPCSSGAQAPCCGGFCCRAQTLGLQASVVVARGFSCSVSCGIFPDQGLNWCFLQCKAGS